LQQPYCERDECLVERLGHGGGGEELVRHEAKLPAAVLGAEDDGEEAGDGAVVTDQAPEGRLDHQQPQAVAEAGLAGRDRGRHLGQQPAPQQRPEEALQVAEVRDQVAGRPGQRRVVDGEVKQGAVLLAEREAVASGVPSGDVPASRSSAASLGKIPTTSVRRPIPRLTRSDGLVLLSLG
jgi:hypothetical protein